MGKQGPCYHCGVTSTPLWRNGPPEKPVLCNACGSRWRTKGTLTNYMPFHSREPIDAKELKVPILKPKEQKFHKRKQSNCSIELEQKHEITDSDQSFWKFPDEDTSNRSNSGSAISYSESCSHFCVTDASDSTGPGHSHAWDSLVPSRKRTCLVRAKPSPVEKLTRDLCSILQQQSCYFSGSSEDDLLYETETPMGSLEIGHGGVLIRHLDSINPEEESEASSLPDNNKKSFVHKAFSGLSALPLDVESKGQKLPTPGNDKVRKTSTAQEHVKRDKAIHEMLHILRSRESPLNDVDLKDVINFEVYMRHLTQEEKQLLMKYLPSIDATGPPESLRSMFGSPQFAENLSSYRQLLMEGIFDPSFSCVDMEESKTLKKLVLVNCMKSKWVEHYTKLKDKKSNDTIGKKGIWNGTNFLDSSNVIPFKRPRDIENQNFSDKKMKTRGAKRSCDQVATSLHSLKSLPMNFSNGGMRSLNDTNEYIENDASFSPRSFFASPLCKSLLPDAFQFSDESSDQGLLLDVPSIACFPEAELLCDTWKQNAGMNSQSAESGTESISYNPTSSSSSHQQ